MSGLQVKSLKAAIEKRQTHLKDLWFLEQSLRLVHQEAPPLRIDKVGEVAVAGWWSDQPPTDAEQQQLAELLAEIPVNFWYLQWRPSKSSGHDPQVVLASEPPPPQEWVFQEHQIKLEARQGQGDNFGLFLDQRDNRQQVMNESKGKKVLNLFSFTCGFSVAAALGGASEVVSVDLSAKYLEWGRKNFQLNDLDDQNYLFKKMDSLDYLAYAARKGLEFDTVICDPPTFSRNGKKVFKIEKDLAALISSCHKALAPKGVLYFSTNCEKLGREDVEEALVGAGAQSTHWQESAVDFDRGQAKPILKSFRAGF